MIGLLAGVALCAAACAEPQVDPEPFALHVGFTNEPVGVADLTLEVDGVVLTGSDGEFLGDPWFSVAYDSYDDALQAGIEVKAYKGGVLTDTCVVHAGVCDGACVPDRESIVLCRAEDGTLRLGPHTCPCGISPDYSCVNRCTVRYP